MRRILLSFLTFLPLLLFSCSTNTPQAAPQVVSVYSTFAAEPWLTELYACADSNVVIVRVDDPTASDIILQVGEPEFIAGFAYQVDEEEILIATHRQSPVQNLNLEGARALFIGLGDPSVQVWVYAPEVDVQQIFDRFVMEGRGVAPSALVAGTPQQMSDTLLNETNAVGILPRRWRAGDLREVYSAATVPVLALTKNEPLGVVNQLLSCLQN